MVEHLPTAIFLPVTGITCMLLQICSSPSSMKNVPDGGYGVVPLEGVSVNAIVDVIPMVVVRLPLTVIPGETSVKSSPITFRVLEYVVVRRSYTSSPRY